MKKNYMIYIFLLLIVIYNAKAETCSYNEDSTYYLPQYTSVTCAKFEAISNREYDLANKASLQENGVYIASYNLGILSSNVQVRFQCGTGNIKGYIPYGCTYNIIKYDSLFFIHIKDSVGNDRDIWTSTLGQGNLITVTIPMGGYLDVMFSGGKALLDSGDVIIQLSSQPYGLKWYGSDGVVSQEGTCDLDQVVSYYNMDKYILKPITIKESNQNNILPPDKYEYIMTGQSAVDSSIHIINKDNKAVYVRQPGGYSETILLNNKCYVNLDAYHDDSCIKCVPGQLCKVVSGCTEPAASIQPDVCTQIRNGVLNMYTYVGNNQECKQYCDLNTLQLVTTSDCREIVKCDGDKPYYDPITNSCIGFISGGGDNDNDNNILLWVILGAVIIIILAIVLSRTKGNATEVF